MPGIATDPQSKADQPEVEKFGCTDESVLSAQTAQERSNKSGGSSETNGEEQGRSREECDVNFLKTRVDETFLDVPKAAVVQGGYDFDEWQFWKKDDLHGPPSHEKLSNPEAFTWAGDVATLEQSLFAEGVVLLGTVSEEWLQQLECFCASTKFDNVLSLGCERREDGYAACGEVLSGPWASWMKALKHSYGYASVITAFPTDGDDQGWHRDTPDDLESEDHQVTMIIYLTEVSVSNGATEFRRITSKDEVSIPGPRGTVVAFESSRTEHRGLANRSAHPRVIMYIAFDD
eukprot:CAMPEP_0181325926 /NCGR_PEP_ID=MMETSP1101-20121128/21206_1 /TAXON_ID=46948 /ORGANISM="Rhodomonas abbreviata, Strain Caron Lab Isolate" /LENGTH=289 /DNA_ID=CAMNT_0023434307 /DNA_START=161 /DNA_END=1030 /DNA_ORIENTATION=+